MKGVKYHGTPFACFGQGEVLNVLLLGRDGELLDDAGTVIGAPGHRVHDGDVRSHQLGHVFVAGGDQGCSSNRT